MKIEMNSYGIQYYVTPRSSVWQDYQKGVSVLHKRNVTAEELCQALDFARDCGLRSKRTTSRG